MRAAARAVLPLALLHGLAGCASGNCDPSQAGFFDGVACQSSGAFNQRENRLQDNLSGARANLYRQQSRANAAAADADAAQTQRDQMARNLQTMARENASLRARFNAAAQRDGANRALIAQRQAELSQLERARIAAERRGASPAEYEQMEQRRRALVDAASSMGS